MTADIKTIKETLRNHLADHRTFADLTEDERWMDVEDIEGYVACWCFGDESWFDAINDCARKALRCRSIKSLKSALEEMLDCARKALQNGCDDAIDYGKKQGFVVDDPEWIAEDRMAWQELDATDHEWTIKMCERLIASLA